MQPRYWILFYMRRMLENVCGTKGLMDVMFNRNAMSYYFVSLLFLFHMLLLSTHPTTDCIIGKCTNINKGMYLNEERGKKQTNKLVSDVSEKNKIKRHCL